MTLDSWRRHALWIMVVIIFQPALVSADESAPDIRSLMSPEEFQASGLDRLNNQQLKSLNNWLLRYTAHEAPMVRKINEAVKQELALTDQIVIKSNIVGSFKGWSGKSTFQLANGQVWQQRQGGRWFFSAESPAVELYRNTLGYWEMRVVAADRAVGVKRID